MANLAARPAQKGDGKLSKGTINRYLSAVSSVLTFAKARKRDDGTPLLPGGLPEIPWQKEAGRRIHFFSEAQEASVVRVMTEAGQLASAFTTGLLCASGLRWSEFISLEPHQCQGEWIKLDDTKTDTPRDVPVDGDLVGQLRALLLDGALPNYLTFRTQLRAAVKSCGFPPQLGIHHCRHTTATRLVKRGVPLPIVQQFMGHKSITTTMRYVHVEADDLHEAMKKLSPQRGKAAEITGASVLPFASKSA